MKKIIISLLLLFIMLSGVNCVLWKSWMFTEVSSAPPFPKQTSQEEQKPSIGKSGPIPERIRAEMRKYSWKPDCPVHLDQLTYLRVPYWGFDSRVDEGELIVHETIAAEVLVIFSDLLKAKFPIERMELLEYYKGSDDDSMSHNNTSGFNCRKSVGKEVMSRHSYGVAIDINPLMNPYVKQGKVLPPKGVRYLDRTQYVKGMIVKHGQCYNAFVRRGWQWGGNWNALKDYQHFEKKW